MNESKTKDMTEATSQDKEEEDRKEREHFVDVLRAFASYPPFMLNEVVRRKRHLERLPLRRGKRLPGGIEGTDRALGDMIGAVQKNSDFLFKICKNPNSYQANFRTRQEEWDLSLQEVQVLQRIRSVRDLDAKGYTCSGLPHHMAKVKGTLHQCYREWSADGAKERGQAFDPLIAELQKRLPVTEKNRNKMRVLVPGSGLGRLVLELCSRGYATQGNEFDYFMLLTCNLILNASDRVNMYEIFPWIEKRCNVYRRADLTSPVRFPDVSPAELVSRNPGYDMSMCAGEFLQVYGSHREEWDAVVACFFLDTAPNIFDYIETIFRMLKPGGFLFSIGPLMYHWARGSASVDTRYDESIELSYDELKHVMISYGFEIVHESRHICKYAVRPSSMLQTQYEAVCFTAMKPEKEGA